MDRYFTNHAPRRECWEKHITSLSQGVGVNCQNSVNRKVFPRICGHIAVSAREKMLQAENSHLPLRPREPAMLRFCRMRSLQKLVAVHASVFDHFDQGRSLSGRDHFKASRDSVIAKCCGICTEKKPWWLSRGEFRIGLTPTQTHDRLLQLSTSVEKISRDRSIHTRQHHQKTSWGGVLGTWHNMCRGAELSLWCVVMPRKCATRSSAKGSS